jgi:hypothetical protein
MIMRVAIALLASAFVLGTPPARLDGATRPQQAPPKPVDDPEAYAVYASLLPHRLPDRPLRRGTLVFQRETGTNWQCMPSGKPLETDWRPVVDNFKAENAGVRTVRPGFGLGAPYVVVPKAEIDAHFVIVPTDPGAGWSEFYKRYQGSGGFFVVSAVGFDPPKRRAMVYLAHSCGGLCGSGTHHFLEKVGGSWREARIPGLSTCMWVS